MADSPLHLDRLTQLAAATALLADVVRKEQTFRFHTPDPAITVYLHVEQAEVRVFRHDQPEVTITTLLQAPFVWRLAAEQDDAGVYLVVRRRPVVKAAVGALAGAVIELIAPTAAHVAARIDSGRLIIERADGGYDLPGRPPALTPPLLLLTEKREKG